uniref:Uncharacterized protein n=1 Tax=viral metagenome TaxID=1070528 RepID=A0A6M3IHK0_9ZZZZ
MKTPKEYLDDIDFKFKAHVVAKQSRFDISWGRWSHLMNREINQRIADNDPESLRLRYVTVYWILMSQRLELSYRRKWLYKVTMKVLKTESEEVKKIILSEAEPAKIEKFDLAKLIIGSNV